MMRAELVNLHRRLGVTTIYVTHDQTEAMTLGQRVAVLREGRIVQVDAPQTLYAKPRNVFVAAFIGSPSMNLVEAVVDADVVRFGGYAVPLDPERRPPTGPVVLGIRPEAFEDAAFADPRLPRLDVHVDVLEQLGADTHACFRVQARAPQLDLGTEGDEVSLLTQETTLFTARLDPRSEAHQRSALALAVDPAAFHFFDVHDGSALAADPTPAAGAEQVPVGSAENWS
jgi:multiple sugar transport system ATP-binding protein